jgi:hypothetical protein
VTPNLEPISVRAGLAGIGEELTMPAMERNEVLQIVEQLRS